MRVEKDLYIAVRDGTALATDLYLPDEANSHPALLVMTPYAKDPVRPTGPLDATGRRIQLPGADTAQPDLVDLIGPAVAPFVAAGFAVLVADARGTGYSEGVYDYYNLEGGPFDGYDLVEWLAAQQWCSGRVGVLGTSASAVYAYLTALTAPPHLEAMVANMHPGDFYFDQWRIGGVFRYDNRIGWALAIQNTTRPIDPGDPTDPSYEHKRAVYESRFRRMAERIADGQAPIDLDWLTELYQRDRYDEFWQRHSLIARAGEITIPTLHGGVWYDHFIRGTLSSHEAISGPKKLIVGPGSLALRPDAGDGGFSALSVAWFERFLADEENDVERTPAARIHLAGAEEWVDISTWPVPTVETDFFLWSNGVLSSEPPLDSELPDELRHDPASPVRTPADVFDLRDFERDSLTFTSAEFDDDMVAIGTPRLHLHAATDATDIDLCVRLCDVDEKGRSRLLNVGALKGSHVMSHKSPTPLVSGDTYCFEIEIWAIANVFRRGHRMRVDLSASDYPFFEVNPLASVTQILHDPEHPSRLVLPVSANKPTNGSGETSRSRP